MFSAHSAEEMVEDADWLLDGAALPPSLRCERLAAELSLVDAWLFSPSEGPDTVNTLSLSAGAERQASGWSELTGGTSAPALPVPTPSAPVPFPPPPSSATAVADKPQLRLLRCLEPGHAQPCVRCMPAPMDGREGDFELVGEPGKKNGEKLLRRLLARTAEWNSPAARAELAAALEARAALVGGESAVRHIKVAENVRMKRSVALTKKDLVMCCRTLGYSSDIWYRHGRATRAADAAGRSKRVVIAAQPPVPYPVALERPVPLSPPAGLDPADPDELSDTAVPPGVWMGLPSPPTPSSAVASDPPLTVIELRLRGGGFAWARPEEVAELTAESAWAAAKSQLFPLVIASSTLLAGREARALFSQPGAPAPNSADVEVLRRAVSTLSAREISFQQMVNYSEQMQAQSFPGSSEDSGVPPAAGEEERAWKALAGAFTHTEAMLLCFANSMRELAMRQSATALPKEDAGQDTLHPAERAASLSIYRGFVAACELSLRLQCLLADARLTRLSVYLSVERSVQKVLVAFIVAAVQAFQERLEWVEASFTARRQANLENLGSPGWANQLLSLEECEAKVAAGCGQVHRDSVSFPSRASSQA